MSENSKLKTKFTANAVLNIQMNVIRMTIYISIACIVEIILQNIALSHNIYTIVYVYYVLMEIIVDTICF